jgi:hypothetical protein
MATYQQKWTCCRRWWCPTCEGVDYLHGPYWYATWRPWVLDPGRGERMYAELVARTPAGEPIHGRMAEDRYKGPTQSLYIGVTRWPKLGTERAGEPPPPAPSGWTTALSPGPRGGFGRRNAERAKARFMKALIAARKLRAAEDTGRWIPRRLQDATIIPITTNPGAARTLRRYWAA